MNKDVIDRPQLSRRMRRNLLLYGALLGLNVALFSWTSPLESPALVVIVGFLVASLDLSVAIRLLMRFFCVLIPTMMPFRRRLTVAVTSFSIVALALASLGQLTWRDVVVVVVIWLLGYMYSLRFSLSLMKS